MLRTDLIEHFAKKQETLNIKNKASNSNIEKPYYYYFNSNAILKAANANSKGNINARDMLGTQTVFPSEEASTSGEYLIYVMPRFVKGSTVYRLFNTEDSKEIKNTVKVKDSSLDNYIYQIDPSSTPDQVELEGETAKLEDTDRAVERNTQNRIKPIQEGETPEQYQERFMKEYHDIVRDINGALQEIDPEQVVKQWQQTQKELEKQKAEEESEITRKAISDNCEPLQASIEAYEESNCSTTLEQTKSMFFKETFLKATSDSANVCSMLVLEITKYITELHTVISRIGESGINVNLPALDNNALRALAMQAASNPNFTESLQDIIKALNAFDQFRESQKETRSISPDHKITLYYLLLNDLMTSAGVTKDKDGNYVFPENSTFASLQGWLTNVKDSVTKFDLESFVNSYSSSEVPYVERLKYAEQILDVARVIVDLSVHKISQKFVNKDRSVESFFGMYSLAMLKVELGKTLEPSEMKDIELEVGLTSEELQIVEAARKKGFDTLNAEEKTTIAKILQKQVPSYIYRPDPTKEISAENLEVLYRFNVEGAQVQEENPSTADLPAFSLDKRTFGSLQIDTPHLIDTHAVLAAYKDEEFSEFVNAYVNNLSEKMGIAGGCSKYAGQKIQPTNTDDEKTNKANIKQNEEMDVCDRLTSHVHFILGRERSSSAGSHADKGETFEEILMLDNLYRMLPEDLSKVRFNKKSGPEAIAEYLRCTSSNKRDYLSQSKSDVTGNEQIEIVSENQDGTQTTETTSVRSLAQGMLPAIKQKAKKAAIQAEAQKVRSLLSELKTDKVQKATYRTYVYDEKGEKQKNADGSYTLVDADTNLRIDPTKYTKAFYDEVGDLLDTLSKTSKKDPSYKKLKAKLEAIVFKYFTAATLEQKAEENKLKIAISAAAYLLEKGEIYEKHKTLLDGVFAGKNNHVTNTILSVIKTRPNIKFEEVQLALEKEITKIEEENKQGLITEEEVVKVVSEEAVIKEVISEVLGGTNSSIEEWITELGISYAKQLTVSGLNVDKYVEHFKVKIFTLIKKTLELGEDFNEDTLVSIIEQSRLEGVRAAFRFINTATPVQNLFTSEDQETFLAELRAQRDPTFVSPPKISHITVKTFTPSITPTISGAQSVKKQRTETEKKLSAAAGTSSTIVNEEYVQANSGKKSKTTKATGSDGLIPKLKEIFGNNTPFVSGNQTAQNVLRNILRSERIVFDVTDAALGDESQKRTSVDASEIERLLRQPRAFQLDENNPIQIDIVKRTKNGEVVTVKDGFSSVDMHAIRITFSVNGKKYTIEIPQQAPSSFRRKSFILLDNVITKTVRFMANADKSKTVAGKDCPSISVDNKINPLAMLTIEDDEGTTFFNVSKLDKIPGKTSGFADLAHFKIKGLKFDKDTDSFKTDESIGLEMTVIEGKVGDEAVAQNSYNRIHAIQNGIVESVLGGNKEALKAIKTARFNVFCGRSSEGRISYARASGHGRSLQIGRMHMRVAEGAASQDTKTQSINSKTLEKILKSVWL